VAGVAVVTDSTADLPADLAEVLGLRIVPLSVQFGEESFISRITITDAQFYERLASSDELPTTSQPAPAWFEEAFGDAVDDEVDAIVSLHVSAALSGTCDLARSVGDSRQVSGGLALQVLAAHRVALAGGDVPDVVAAAAAVREATCSFLVVDTLDHLRKGGRLSSTQATVGNVLRVKPVLGVVDGEVELLERTRTWGRALDRMVELVAGTVGPEPAHVVVAHALAPERAAELRERLEAEVDVAERLDVVMGPIVGTHVGPGAVAVAACPAGLT
jgi:DegV family protein with EDD domain